MARTRAFADAFVAILSAAIPLIGTPVFFAINGSFLSLLSSRSSFLLCPLRSVRFDAPSLTPLSIFLVSFASNRYQAWTRPHGTLPSTQEVHSRAEEGFHPRAPRSLHRVGNDDDAVGVDSYCWVSRPSPPSYPPKRKRENDNEKKKKKKNGLLTLLLRVSFVPRSSQTRHVLLLQRSRSRSPRCRSREEARKGCRGREGDQGWEEEGALD